jgi:hypothetical protein
MFLESFSSHFAATDYHRHENELFVGRSVFGQHCRGLCLYIWYAPHYYSTESFLTEQQNKESGTSLIKKETCHLQSFCLSILIFKRA